MELLNEITKWVLYALAFCVAYKFVYLFVGVFWKAKRYKDTGERKKFGILIAARDEEKVIGNLVESLNQQNYPKELITVFVVADNCTDKTAQIAREKGAVVYERFDETKKRKGWALEFLLDNIKKDYGIDSFDAYMIFDADNVVDPNCVLEMNNALCAGAKICVGYRRTKNFATNPCTAYNSIHFCRTSLMSHRPRQLLGLSTHIAGPGHCFASELLLDGWKYHRLAEDTEGTMDMVAKGEKVWYNEYAIHYDEQPTNLRIVLRQRLRWMRGRLVCFVKKSGGLFSGMFKKKRTFADRWACWDCFWYVFPYQLFTILIGAIYPITSAIVSLVQGIPLPWLDWLKAIGIGLGTFYLSSFMTGLLVAIRERKNYKCGPWKMFLYLLCLPFFDFVNIPNFFIGIFVPVKWKKIEHKDQTSIEAFEQLQTQPQAETADEVVFDELEEVSKEEK